MNLADAEIRQRLVLREDSGWEFKQIEFRGNRPVHPTRDDWADEITAFANASGGVLLCGVSDTGELQGLMPEQLVELDRLIAEVCTDSIKPALPVEIHHHEIDGKALIAVQVPKGSSLHECKGQSFIRVGASKRVMTSDERLRLSQAKTQARYLRYDEQTVPGTGFETLDESLWMPLLSADGRTDPRPALEKMRLLGADEGGNLCATVAGILSCCRNPEEWLPQACITATLYRGVDRASGQIDAQTIAGPLTRQIADAVAFAVRNMRVGAPQGPGPYRSAAVQYTGTVRGHHECGCSPRLLDAAAAVSVSRCSRTGLKFNRRVPWPTVSALKTCRIGKRHATKCWRLSSEEPASAESTVPKSVFSSWSAGETAFQSSTRRRRN